MQTVCLDCSEIDYFWMGSEWQLLHRIDMWTVGAIEKSFIKHANLHSGLDPKKIRFKEIF